MNAKIADNVPWFEKALAILGFLLLMGVFSSITRSGAVDRTEGSKLFQLFGGGIYLSAVILLVARKFPVSVFSVLLRAWPLVLLTLLPLLSTIWSQAPEATFRRSLALTLSSSFAVYIMVRFNPRTIFNLLALSFAVYVVLGIAAAAIPGGSGISANIRYTGALEGIAGGKNSFGRTLALAVAILPISAALGLVDRRRSVLLVSLVALMLLSLSRSATSIAAALGSITGGGMLYVALGGRIGRIRIRPELGLPLLVITVVTGTLVLTYGWTPILEALGRDPTLTGRTKLWEWAIHINNARQWLGSGYRAFWIDENTKYFFESFYWHSDAEGNQSDSFAGPSHAHSSYVDIYLELGRLGLIVFGTVVVSALYNIRQASSRVDTDLGLLLSIIIVFLLIHSVAEQSILQQTNDLWFFFTLFYLFAVKANITALRAPAQIVVEQSQLAPQLANRELKVRGWQLR